DIIDMNCKVRENALLPRLHCIVDAKDTNNDTSLHIQNSSEKVISNELQIDMQSVNKFENELDVAGLFVDNKKGQCKEAVGHQLRFKIHSESNKDNDTNASIQSEYDASIDEKLPETVTLLTTPEGGKLYLVGTAHFSVKSQNDIIQAVQPHIVAVELCEARINIINITEEAIYHNTKELDISRLIEILKCYGVYYGLLHIVLYRMMARLVKEFGMPPGGEFRTAFKEAKKIPNCIIQLADRSINVTFLRALRQLSWWEIIKLIWLIIQSDSCISIQDIEHYKQKCVLKQMILSLKEKYPAIEKTFITERDIYLTYHLQEAIAAQLTSKQSPRVVAVVGIGHTDGIIKNWGKVEASDILPIMWYG
ncbi:TraB domain-containing protein, partial [Eufriesea mexicana]